MSTVASEHNRFMSSDLNRPRLDENGVRDLKSSNQMIERLTDKLNGYLSQRQTANTLGPVVADDFSVARPSYMPLGSVHNQLSSTSTGWGRSAHNHSGPDHLSSLERYGASRIAQIERKIQQAQAENLLMQRLAKSDKELLLTNYATRMRYFNDKAAQRYFLDNYVQDVPRIPVRLGPVAGMPNTNTNQSGWDDGRSQTFNDGKQNKSGVRSMSQLYKSETKVRSKSRLDDKSTRDRKSVKSNQSSRSKSKSILSRSLSKSKSKSGVKTLTRSASRLNQPKFQKANSLKSGKSKRADSSLPRPKNQPKKVSLKKHTSRSVARPQTLNKGGSGVAVIPRKAVPRLIGKKKKTRGLEF